VNDTRSQRPAAEGAGTPSAWVRFWFAPADPVGLHALRVLAGLLFLAWLLPFAGHTDSMFGLAGWFDHQAYSEAARLLNEPLRPMGWSLTYLAGTDAQTLTTVYWASIAVLVLFTLGVWTRLTSVLAWVIVVSFTINPAIEYDADAFLVLFAFYLMVGYLFLGQAERGQSIWRRLLGSSDTLFLGRPGAAPSVAANAAVRLWQVHFAFVILASGLHKLQFGDWWGGAALWYPLYPAGIATIKEAREHVGDARSFLIAISFGAYAILAWQLAFPLFAWRQRRPIDPGTEGWLRWVGSVVFSARTVLIGGAAVGWLGTALLFRLPLVGPAVLVGCLGYLTPREWEGVRALLARAPGLGRLARASQAEEEPAEAVESLEPATMVTVRGSR
jgi:hypothetical protein